MQTITDELRDILKDHFQAAADGFRARLEVSTYFPHVPSDISIVQIAYAGAYYASFADVVTPGHAIVAIEGQRTPTLDLNMAAGGAAFTTRASSYYNEGGHFRGVAIGDCTVPVDPLDVSPAGDGRSFETTVRDRVLLLLEVRGEYGGIANNHGSSPTNNTYGLHDATYPMDCGGDVTPAVDTPSLIVGVGVYGQASYASYGVITPPVGSDITELVDAGNGPHTWIGYRIVDAPDGSTAYRLGGTYSGGVGWTYYAGATVVYTPIEEGEGEAGATVIWTPYALQSVNLDKSLRLVADQAEAELENEAGLLGWGPTSVFRTNQRIRIWQWYGEVANEVRSFTGLIDRIRDHRDVRSVTLSCRDMMALLIDTNFSAIAPQQADEVGAVRTTANGVYLSMEVSAIVSDFLDRVGWPEADRAITDTSYVLDEFIISDGASYADAMIGDEQLTGLVGYSAWADEAGVFHFAPTLISQNLTDPDEPVYTFESGVDIVSLDDEVDQYDLRTRVKVRGPLTTTTLEDTWRELWRTSKIKHPVGLWYAPADPSIIRVIDSGTKRMYRIRQSDREVLGSVYLGGVASSPLGLSGDPADASVYWVLNAPWFFGGSTSNNKLKKIRKSDHVVLASYDILNGRLSAVKVSASYAYVTNLDTDRFYRLDKTDGSTISSYQHTHNGNLQANPSGLMIDGTTLYLFWANGGSTARFLKCDESAPGTVTGVVRTAGTTLHGGEMDTTTHTECYGDNDSLGLVAKFTLKAAVDSTDEVFAEVIDVDLEDELGALAGVEDREHDAHTGDPDHPFETRRLTLDLEVITSLAQATETAQRQLDIASQRRRVLDAGIIGNPALQKTDLVSVTDGVTGLSTSFAIDTYRSQMVEGTYLGVVAMLPVEAPEDEPTDDGDASE